VIGLELAFGLMFNTMTDGCDMISSKNKKTNKNKN
jgi:hypothetical protein